KVRKRGVACVAPMELLIGALQEAARGKAPAGLGVEKRDVNARGVLGLGELGRSGGEQGLIGERALIAPDEKTPPGNRGEGDGDLQLRIVAAPGIGVGFRPSMVEDVFALAVRLEIAGRAAENLLPIAEHEVARAPA